MATYTSFWTVAGIIVAGVVLPIWLLTLLVVARLVRGMRRSLDGVAAALEGGQSFGTLAGGDAPQAHTVRTTRLDRSWHHAVAAGDRAAVHVRRVHAPHCRPAAPVRPRD